MKKRNIIFVLLATLLFSACGQRQEPATLTEPPVATIPPPTETPAPTPTNEPDPALLETAESLHLAPGLALRFATQTTTPEDDAIIAAIGNEEIYLIHGLYFDRVGSLEGSENAPEGAPAYVLIGGDDAGRVVGWYDASGEYVVEAATDYHMYIRDNPGVGIENGPDGEEFYVYGYAWYTRWERIFPEPAIQLLEDFYTVGIEHVSTNLENYQKVAAPDYFGGNLKKLTWDENLPATLEKWGKNFPAAPHIAFPDSGTVDIRDTRFQEAIDNKLVNVNRSAIDKYVASDFPRNSSYSTYQPKDAVINKLFSPFKSPDKYSDLQKHIILGYIYDGNGPLVISIDFGMEGGFFAPASGEKKFYVAPSEVDLMFGYDGIYLAKIPHEITHLVESSDYRYNLFENCSLKTTKHEVETLKYVMEYMWWVQQYPGDAPYWDWEPINSGLVLANMISKSYQNFSCGN